MSLKNTKEVLRRFRNFAEDDDERVAAEALAEIAALEKAAKDIGICRAMPTPTPEARHASIQGSVLLATIAKEAE